MALLLGFDIGGTKIGIGLGDQTGKLYGTCRRDNRNTDPAEVLPWMVSEAQRLVSEAEHTGSEYYKVSDCAGAALPSVRTE